MQTLVCNFAERASARIRKLGGKSVGASLGAKQFFERVLRAAFVLETSISPSNSTGLFNSGLQRLLF